ncbi:MAG: (Fe-S)-binding protein [Candidatus Glassbacteria bacterium]
MNISLFIPCLIDQFYPEVAFSTYRLLKDLDLKVDYPRDQTCCGQPAYNAGYFREAGRLATHFLQVFHHCEYVVSPSGSCVSMVRNSFKNLPLSSESKRILGELVPRTYELTEFLVDIYGESSLGAVFHNRVTYHDSCHLLRELGVRDQPRQLLKNVEGIELVEMQGSMDCCGFGGVFSAKYKKLAMDVARSKIENASLTGADYIVSCDAGCIQHLEAAAKVSGMFIKPIHIASVLRPGGIR